MNDDLLASAVAAVRDTDADDGELAAMTRSRLRRTLESRARGRRQLVSFLTMTAILFGGTMSWALSTGRTGELWTAVAGPAVVPEAARVLDDASSERAPAVERSRVAARQAPEPVVVEPPAVEPVAVEATIETKTIETKASETTIEAKTTPAVERPARPVTVPAPRPTAIEALYRKAHELHFHGGDPPATLAAWDAYLAAEPTGRFVVEARYNRALILIRIGRYAEARTALAPFARGEVQPAGYREADAGKLVERLDDLLRAP